MKTENINGVDYVIGSAEHRVAVEARAEWRERTDAALYKQNEHLVEPLTRRLHGWDELRLDANKTAFIARDLVYMRGQQERVIYERVRVPEFVPVESNHPRGAASYTTRLMDHVGEAKITHDLAGDAPRVDVEVSEDIRKYVNIRASYGYTTQEMEHAAFAGVSLDRDKAEACADVIARGLDKVGREGNALANLTGFFNNANVTVYTLPNGEWDSTATVDEIVADLNSIEGKIITDSKDTQPSGFSLVLPTVHEGKVATTPRATGSDMSIKAWWLANNRGVVTSIERYGALDAAVSPAVVAADPPQGICYPKNNSVLFWPIPIMYDEQAAELRGWEYVVQARARCGGVEVRRPMHMLYIENLD